MTIEADQRSAVVAEARTWLGTPYHSHARLKGVGVDCANLPAAVYEAVGLTPHIRPAYSDQWFLHHDAELYLAQVIPFARREITVDEIGPGDLGVWRYGRTYSHGAIILDRPLVIHATLPGGGVHLGDLDRDEDLRSRPRRFFTLWG